MFEETLLIIKPDYLHKRKLVLLKLLEQGFQIQGNRRLLFSPEHAGEFYETISEEKNYMLQVIELSKGNCEAFILTKDNAIEELINTMVCYFTNSIEMVKMVHTSKCAAAVQREISYIFPNYIHEPIPWFDKNKFCKQRLPSGLFKELYDLIRTIDPTKESWKVRVAEWCMLNNETVPIITHQCSRKPFTRSQDQSEQTSVQGKPAGVRTTGHSASSSRRPSLTSSSGGSSGLITSSSCMTCTSLASHDICDRISPSEILRMRTIPLMKTETCVLPSSSEADEADDEVEPQAAPAAAEEQEVVVEEEYPDYPIEGYVVTYGHDDVEEPPEAIPSPSVSVGEVPEAEEVGAIETAASGQAEVADDEGVTVEAVGEATAEVVGEEPTVEAQVPPAEEDQPAAAQPEEAALPQPDQEAVDGETDAAEKTADTPEAPTEVEAPAPAE